MAEARTPRRRAGKADPETGEAIYQAILRAIMEGKLKAGTKLVENPLAQIFKVSRERIRKVLHRLGAERRREVNPNPGPRAPRPTAGGRRIDHHDPPRLGGGPPGQPPRRRHA